ncbi:hypothetical protein CHS0354_013425 [Potamilus streckersoni]|uniref:Uncharacterized protein n=1 Tax=Potamilus streckersoni TaxID=2493646 RepID=A0AAE0RV32_9BIVA|nr:hypothetical protein CHS0354_013425 [Potamilus streckersoni]
MSRFFTALKNLFSRKNDKASQTKSQTHDDSYPDVAGNDDAAAGKSSMYENIDVDNGQLSVATDSSKADSNTDQLNYVELDFGKKGKKKGKSGKSVKIIGAGSSVEYTEIQIQHE